MAFESIFKYIEDNENFNNPIFLEKAYEFSLEKLRIEKIKINTPFFREIYGEDEVNEDIRQIKLAEANFKEKNSPEDEKNKKLATILEAVLYYQIEQNCIFGMDDVHTISTSKYDDYFYGVDAIMEILLEEIKEVAVAFDATYAGEEKLYEKINSIKTGIKNGKMAHVKYFKSDNSDKHSLDKIPKMIIGMGVPNLEEIIKMWMSSDAGEKGVNEKIVNHPFRFIILDEILIQLEIYIDYAESVNRSEIAKELNELLLFFKEIDNNTSELRKSVISDFDNQDKYNNDKILQFFKKLKKESTFKKT